MVRIGEVKELKTIGNDLFYMIVTDIKNNKVYAQMMKKVLGTKITTPMTKLTAPLSNYDRICREMCA